MKYCDAISHPWPKCKAIETAVEVQAGLDE